MKPKWNLKRRAKGASKDSWRSVSDKQIHKSSLGFHLKKKKISVRNVICMFKANVGFCLTAGKVTTDEELEEMLEGGNAAVFSAGVSTILYTLCDVLLKEHNLSVCF